MTNWKLGESQRGVLKSLRDQGGYPGRWYWENASRTTSILESLVKRGLVEKIELKEDGLTLALEVPSTRYEIADAGREALEALGGIYASPKPKPKTAQEIEYERIEAMGPNTLKHEFEQIMASISRTSNVERLADLARQAGMVWTELTGRGIEF